MSVMLSKLYTALKAAGAPEDQAQDAATEAAGYATRLTKMEADLQVLKWMAGANTGLTLIVLSQLFLS